MNSYTQRTVSSAARALLIARPFLHRFAVRVSARHRDLVSADDARGIADLAMVSALARFRGWRARAFASYARHWVFGALRRAVRGELEHLRGREEYQVLAWQSRPVAPPDRRLELTEALSRLPAAHREVVVRRVVAREPFAVIARRAGRHRAWACRAYQRSVELLADDP
jgi:DNA-directed RNA polymerase specialized sigma24 family protein